MVDPFNWVKDKDAEKKFKIILNYNNKYSLLKAKLNREKFNINIGDELPTGVLKLAKIYVARKES